MKVGNVVRKFVFSPFKTMLTHLSIYCPVKNELLNGNFFLLSEFIFRLCPPVLFFNSDAPVSELSLELLLLQVVLPALLEQGHTRQWLKGLVRAWTVSAGYLL